MQHQAASSQTVPPEIRVARNREITQTFVYILSPGRPRFMVSYVCHYGLATSDPE